MPYKSVQCKYACNSLNMEYSRKGYLHHKVRGCAGCVERRLSGAGRGKRPRIPTEPEPYLSSFQSFAQLDKNYGREGSEIITDNTQLTLFGGFAPNSKSAETLSKSLGSQTVATGSVSKGKNDPSRSLQMMERPLKTADELKALPFGDFILMKTGARPMETRLNLYFKWGIDLDTLYEVPEQGDRKVEYADQDELLDAILEKYPPREMLRTAPESTPPPKAKKKVRT